MPDQVITELIKTYGAPGIIIAVLLWICSKLVTRNEQLTDKYIALAEKVTVAFEQNTASRNAMTVVFDNLKRSIDDAVILPRRGIGRRHEDS